MLFAEPKPQDQFSLHLRTEAQMNRVRSFIILAALIASTVSPVSAVQTSERALQAFDNRQAASLAIRLLQDSMTKDLDARLVAYHPLSTAAVNDMKDVGALRSQVIAAQNAERLSREAIATMSDAEAASAAAQVSAAIVGALRSPGPASVTVAVPGADSGKVVSVYSTTIQGLAKAVTPTTSGVCKVLSYATSAYSAASPQFVSAAGSTGQKNTLSIAGFVLGIFPVAMQCSDDHATVK
jgi:hypothetical protein